MTVKISLTQFSGAKFSGDIDRHPDYCPMCHTSVLPHPVSANHMGDMHDPALEIAYVCPNSKCSRMFIGYFASPYRLPPHHERVYRFIRAQPTTPIPSNFAQSIRDISPDFCSIVEEANRAEQLGLTEVCGVGYRKRSNSLSRITL
jgi:hypothetical protein